MGKTEDALEEKSTDNDKENEQPQPSEENQPTKNDSEASVEDVESLRTVIKLDEKDGENKMGEEEKKDNEEEKTEEPEDLDGVGDLVEESEETGNTASASSREALEQKRALLQRIKDFDLQIKKNQQDITDISEKMNAISKDLDDLVSLYEIVSEQMNPFVGLSKVTKKRLESFETLNNELSTIKEKISIIEAGGNFDFSKIDESHTNDIDVTTDDDTDFIEPETQTELPDDHMPGNVKIDLESGIDSIYDFELTDDEIDQILEMSFSKIPSDNQLDLIIDEYIESLKDGKAN